MYTFPILQVTVDFKTHMKEYKQISMLVLCTYTDIKKTLYGLLQVIVQHIFIGNTVIYS